MPWQVSVPPTAKANVRKALEELKLEDGQMSDAPVAAREAQRAQFAMAKAMAATVAEAIAGPKVQGALSGHSNGTGAEAMPPGAIAERITVDLWQVRFVGD